MCQKHPDFDEGRYADSVFGMYGGNEKQVTLLCKNTLSGAIIDRFGKGIMLIPIDSEHFSVTVNVKISPQFYGWVCGFGADIKITSPADVVNDYKTILKEILNTYEKDK